MSDKSFGDYTNRNIVKNPLLSTAVTGLSIEDLTHNAVLVPVSLSQEVITRPAHKSRGPGWKEALYSVFDRQPGHTWCVGEPIRI